MSGKGRLQLEPGLSAKAGEGGNQEMKSSPEFISVGQQHTCILQESSLVQPRPAEPSARFRRQTPDRAACTPEHKAEVVVKGSRAGSTLEVLIFLSEHSSLPVQARTQS